MHPAISYHLALAHVADLRHRAQRDTLARAARLARRSQPGLAPSRLGTWGRRAQARLIALMTPVYQRRRDSPVAQTRRAVPSPLGIRSETHPHSGPPDPKSGRAGDRFALIPAACATPARAYSILSSPTEEGHARNTE
jgi:hypothetical protein